MSKEKTKAAGNKESKRKNGEIILGLCKPHTGGKYKGWTLCEVTRETIRLIGENELKAILNNSECATNNEIITACKKGLDLGRALSLCIQLARKFHYTPCEAARLYGDGATKLVETLDDAKKALKVYTGKTAKALKALLESKESERAKLFKEYQAAAKEEGEHREVYTKAMKKYNRDCADCTKILTMNQLRKA